MNIESTKHCSQCGEEMTYYDGWHCPSGCDQAPQPLCSQLKVQQAVLACFTKEMEELAKDECFAGNDRHWSLADALKNKRLAFDAALGLAMKGIEQAYLNLVTTKPDENPKADTH